MSDTTINQFVAQFADAVARAAFVPSPPTPAADGDNGYFAYQQDDGSIWCWDSAGSAWVQVGGSGSLSGAALSVLGNATNAPAALADIVAGSDFQVLRRSGTAVGFGSVNLASSNAVTGDLPFANLAQGTALSVLGVTGNATADNASIVAASDFQVMRRSGTAVAFGSVNLASTNAVGTSILPAANGGTGVASGFSTQLMTEVTIADADIKKLPTTPYQLVAAPAAGTYIEYSKVVLITKFAGGAYTGAAAVSGIQASVNGVGFTTIIANNNTTTPAISALTRFLGAASRKAILVPYLGGVDEASGDDYVLTSLADGTEGIDTMATFSGGNMSLFADSGGVDFGGGNGANTLIARVYYTLNTVP